jgi:hypothetical protein
MFISIELNHRFLPLMKSTSYINLRNVYRIGHTKNKVNIYSSLKPQTVANSISFPSEQDAKAFVDLCMNIALEKETQPQEKKEKPVERLDQASPDPLAIAAIADTQELR